VYSRLSEQIAALGTAAGTLSRALRTPAVRGRWGEMQLRRVVEVAGMQQRCDFDEQPALQGENGRLRPDLVVHLPGGKQVVVDAKAPLEAFLDAQESADEETRGLRLQAHARQVREHVDKLASKSYWDALGNSPELVVLFLPGETLFSAALQHDLGLIEYALGQRCCWRARSRSSPCSPPSPTRGARRRSPTTIARWRPSDAISTIGSRR
jgi:DNA recombination protein RmuC